MAASKGVRKCMGCIRAFVLTISGLGSAWFFINQLNIINTQSPSWFTWVISRDTNIMQ